MKKQIGIGVIIILIAVIIGFNFMPKQEIRDEFTCNLNQICEESENYIVCPEDCADTVCNHDTLCTPPEDSQNCEDCNYNYVCPETNNIDCIPMIDSPMPDECEQPYYNWIQMNCPDVEFTH